MAIKMPQKLGSASPFASKPVPRVHPPIKKPVIKTPPTKPGSPVSGPGVARTHPPLKTGYKKGGMVKGKRK